MAWIIDKLPELFSRKPNSDTIYLRRSGFAFCPVCQKLVELLSFNAAADLFKTNVQDIESLAEGGQLHRVHNRKGVVLVCSDSLFKCIDSRETMRLDPEFEMETKNVFRGELNELPAEERNCL